MCKTLMILNGCPNGATEAALEMNGVESEELATLVDSGDIVAVTETLVRPAGMTVTRYYVAG